MTGGLTGGRGLCASEHCEETRGVDWGFDWGFDWGIFIYVIAIIVTVVLIVIIIVIVVMAVVRVVLMVVFGLSVQYIRMFALLKYHDQSSTAQHNTT